jgi:hypothetical protein
MKTMMQGFLIFKCISKVFLFGRKEVGRVQKVLFSKENNGKFASGGGFLHFFLF